MSLFHFTDEVNDKHIFSSFNIRSSCQTSRPFCIFYSPRRFRSYSNQIQNKLSASSVLETAQQKLCNFRKKNLQKLPIFEKRLIKRFKIKLLGFLNETELCAFLNVCALLNCSYLCTTIIFITIYFRDYNCAE